MRQNSLFRLPRGHRFFAKNGSYGYGNKSWWEHPRVHLGANVVPLCPKNGSKPQKITMPQNSNFRLPCGHRFFPKNGSYGYGAKSRLGYRRVALWANGVRLGPKNGSEPKRITMPQNSHFQLPRGHRFFVKKMEVTVMVPNHGGDPVGSILGPMGSHWVKKMGQNCKKLPCPKIRIFNCHRFFVKNGSYGCGTKSRWGPCRVHLGANGSHWVQKMGQNRKKLPCPKIRIFDYPAIIDFT